jgi:hypothetical protein
MITMARANDARCLCCGAKLSRYRKLSDTEFCSAAHRKEFQDNQSKLAVERLAESQKLLRRTIQPSSKLEAPPLAALLISRSSCALAPASVPADPIAEHVSRPLAPFIRATAEGFSPCAAGRVPIPVQIQASALARLPQALALRIDLPHAATSLTSGSNVRDPMMDTGKIARLGLMQPHLGDRTPAVRTDKWEGRIAGPAICRSGVAWTAGLISYGRVVRLPEGKGRADLASRCSGEALRAPGQLALPRYEGTAQVKLRISARVDWRAAIACTARLRSLPSPVQRKPAPVCGRSVHLTIAPLRSRLRTNSSVARNCETALRVCDWERAIPAVGLPRLGRMRPSSGAGTSTSVGVPRPAPLRSRTDDKVTPVAIARRTDVRAPISGPTMSAAIGLKASLIAIPIGASGMAPEWHPRGIDAESMRSKGDHAVKPAAVIPAARARRLILCGKVRIAPAPASNRQIAVEPAEAAPFAAGRVYPRGRYTLERIDECAAFPPFPRDWRDRARMLAGLWPAASMRVRVTAVLVPLLTLFAWHEWPARNHAQPGGTPTFMSARLSAVRNLIQRRAGIEYADDFRSGLDNWQSRGNVTEAWSYDQTGFVRPGPLALYKPTLGLEDYNLEFLGQIDRKALGWVFRAADLNNYHAAKLTVLSGGPMPQIGLVRYSVKSGKEGPHTTAVLPLNVFGDTMYRVRMEVRGSDFAVYVQNHLVQFWTDARFKSGGVGFFSGKGEQSRIRWVQVSHQNDAMGKLCAYIAPVAAISYGLGN